MPCHPKVSSAQREPCWPLFVWHRGVANLTGLYSDGRSKPLWGLPGRHPPK